MRRSGICGILIVFVWFACEEKTQTLFSRISPKQSGVMFSNVIESSNDFNIFSYRNFYNGGGVAIGDINNDDLPDVYLISNMESNKLYLNKGDLKFEDITDKANTGGTKAWSTGVVFIDINSDGFLDIYVCNAGYQPSKSNQENELFINNGDLTFIEKAEEYGLNHDGYTTHAAFFDYDTDGDLDVYILNNSFMPVNTLNYSNQRKLAAENWPVKDFLKGGGDKLYKNENGFYTDVTKEAGIYSSLIGFGLGVTVGDVNGDHLPDMYISNDFFERDYLYINNGDGTFSEEIEHRMGHISLASMGADMADINNDGFPEIFVSEMLPDEEKRLKTEVLFENYPNYHMKLQRGFYHQYMHNTLQLNNGDNSFSEIAWYSGVAASDWSWGALMFDTDNDGFRDIYVCNGTFQDVTNQDFITFFADEVVQKMALTGEKEEMEYVMQRMPSNKQYNRLFSNNTDLTFTEAGTESGFDIKSFSNGAAYGDLDNDGDLDLVVNNLNQEAFLYENNSEAISNNHFISIKLIGEDKNTYAIGSNIRVYSNKSTFNSYLMPSRGFQSSIDYKVVIGIGNNTSIDSVVVIWPDKNKSKLLRPSIDTTFVISHKNSKTLDDPNEYQTEMANEFVKEIENGFDKHTEDEYIDFLQEGLVIKMLSREGPAGDVGDLNGDGKADVLIGGARGQSARVYIRYKSGFMVKPNSILASDAHFEDTSVELFDADADGDLDAFIGSGGNHQPQNSGLLHDRLYFNDGSGLFGRRANSLPKIGYNTSVARSFDIDRDEDLDLFVGSRSIPMKYGVPPQSFIYENKGDGSFKDATLYFAPFLKSMGMITNAHFVNLIGDNDDELVLIGEWMSPVILKKKNNKFERVNSTLERYSGWWYAIESDDVDNDGDQDLILGNRGENFYFTGSREAPAKLWLWDFDNNGFIEKIITRQIDGRDVTVALKKELTEQISNLYQQNFTHEEFAGKSIQDLFAPELLERALVRYGTWFKSSIAFNEGNGNFKVIPLPEKVQFSSVNAILSVDVNRDGSNDLILGGNNSEFMPQYSRLDASFGHLLINDGRGAFTKLNNKKSGFFVQGDVRNILPIDMNNKEGFLVLLNNKKPKLYELTGKNHERK
ncbi:MAG: FG-GAP-like repeat-containing protein [Cytophagales bacterium]|nr:FG-GAP-like repeat-containing protein [Cytophagales bacterium]